MLKSQKVSLFLLFFYKIYTPKILLSFNEVLINWKYDRRENSLQDLTTFIRKLTKEKLRIYSLFPLDYANKTMVYDHKFFMTAEAAEGPKFLTKSQLISKVFFS